MQLNTPLRVRTLTAGIDVALPLDLQRIERVIEVLHRGRAAFEKTGYEVQTLRIATNPWLASLSDVRRDEALDALKQLDDLVASHGVIVSVGPIQTSDADDDQRVAWACKLIGLTHHISFSCVIGSASKGVHAASAFTAAHLILALSRAVPEGMANFRFAAGANIPAGTPFFPVAWHEGEASLALGVESAAVVEQAFTEVRAEDAGQSLRVLMNAALKPLERIGVEFAAMEGKRWLGIDASPAPAQDRSIGAAIEKLTGRPFGCTGTLEACATITGAIKSLDVKTCGYSGLMLPVLEDARLAQRAGEGRFSVRDLLLYSSVCGTGLDVVPIPGDTPVETIAALLRDVATLSSRLQKPLSARLFPIPGKRAGDIAHFSDPLLTDCAILPVD